MLVIYSKEKSPRLSYVLNHLFSSRLGLSFQHVSDINELQNNPHQIINYSDLKIENSIQIVPEDLLFQSKIEFWNMNYDENEKETLLELSKDQVISFDLFAAIFFHLSRYEEYLFIEKDQHQRFDFQNSSLFKSECLNHPVVDIWIMAFKNILIQDFNIPIESFKKEQFEICPTIDVDMIYAYKGRSFLRGSLAFLKNLLFLQFNSIKNRIMCVVFNQKDPFDNFDYQIETLKKHELKANYFFQVGPYGTYDKNINNKHPAYKTIIEFLLKNGHRVGLHPSYQSNSDVEKIKTEHQTLNAISGQKLSTSRQHYLRFELPKTYRTLIELGIEREFSMGYSEEYGFRAGTAFPFKWFDLLNNESTNLEIVPFCAMDVCFQNYKSLSIEETLSAVEQLKSELKNLNAPFWFVFHNESLSNHQQWNKWRKVWEKCLEH